MVGGKKLAEIPHSKWVHFHIVCKLGYRATGHYELTVTLPGVDKDLRFPNLPCSPCFQGLRWIGFMADGNQPGVFYMDDLSMTPDGIRDNNEH
jgi:hypothetical protein